MEKTVSIIKKPEAIACCGIKEMAPIQGDKQSHRILFEAGIDFFRNDNDAAFLYFSEAHDEGENPSIRGEKLATYITEKGLGNVFASERVDNPNSARLLKMWVWTVDVDAYKTWWEAGIEKWGADYEIEA